MTAHLLKFNNDNFMKRLFFTALSIVLLASCVNEQLESQPVQDTASVTAEGAFKSGECVVLFSEEVTAQIEASLELGQLKTKAAGIDDMLEQLGVTSMERLFPHAGEYEIRTRREGLHRWYVLKYSDLVPFTKADAGLGCLPGVEIVEPVRKIKNHDFDDLSSDLWGLQNVSYPEYDINVTPVWKDYTTGNPDVIVAVVDNGVQLDHPDLKANCLTTGHFNAVDNSFKIFPGDHGTHVAGTIAAVGNNGIGVVGVAGGDFADGKAGVKILSCQIFKDTAEGTVSSSAASAAAIKYGADNGAVISQNSWGYNFDDNGDGHIDGNEIKAAESANIYQSEKVAVDYFIKYAGCDNYGNQLKTSPMKGGVVIFAAGNDNIKYGAPANYEAVIAVGSIAPNGSKSSFSNYGDWVDIAAPGTDILSTLTGSKYGVMSGTSMACPHVSGVAALVGSRCGGPGFTNEMLKEKLLKGSNPNAVPSSYKIGNLVDALGAITYGSDAAPKKVDDLSASARANTMDITWTATADPAGKSAYGYLALYGTDKAKVAAATKSDYGNVGFAVCTPDAVAGEKVKFAVKGLEFNKHYYVKLLAFSYGRNYADASDIVEFNTGSNNAPEINPKTDGPFSVKASETLEVKFQIVDPDDHDLEVKMTCDVEHTFAPSLVAGEYIFKVVGKNVNPGSYEAVVNATDEYGLQTKKTIPFEVLDNQAPVMVQEIEDILLSSRGKEFIIDMEDYVSDPDGEQLKYTISVSNAKVVNVTPRQDILYVTALAYGLVDVKVTASDVRGQSVEFDFKVLVKDTSDPLSLYPNPVKDFLNVSTVDLADTEIVISSSTGKVMYHDVMKVSALQPARIDMSSYVPGTYSVQVRFGGKEYKKNVVKL